MHKALITGASGLIGSRIVRHLAQRHVAVAAAVRRPSNQIAGELNVPLYALDVLNPRADALAGVQAECLIHCATANDILSKDAARGFELSVSGTWNVLELARSLAIRRVIYFSTFQVYGTELTGVVDEDRPPHCETAYGMNHWFGEEVCRLFAAKHSLSIAVVRPSNVYGAPVATTVRRETLVPACFVRAAVEQGEIVIQSSGRQQRNFVSTREVAEACAYLLDHMPPDFEVFNLCSAYNAPILDIARLTADVYEARTHRQLPIQVRSPHPLQGNDFEAQSKLSFLWNSPEHSAASMRAEIAALFSQMAGDVRFASAA